MNRILTSAILSLTLACSSTVLAQDFQNGEEAYSAGDYAGAFKEWWLLAEQGHLRAQMRLGDMFANGQYVIRDNAQAAKWYLSSAEVGNAEAQYNLGLIYSEGEGVEQDDTNGA